MPLSAQKPGRSQTKDQQMPDNQVNIVVTAVDQASKTLKAVGDAFNTLSSGVRGYINEFSSYGAGIKDIASYTGLSSAETSRMVQVFDDAGVSIDTVRQAAKALTAENAQTAKETEKLKGQIADLQKEMTTKPSEELRAKLTDLQNQLKDMAPAANLSIDTLARLSDEFLAIKDPADQAIFLQDKFKRSGEDLAKVMRMGGDAIRENAKGVSDSLIIDDEKAKRIEATRVKLDEFNDQLQGMRYDTADKLLDIFGDMPKPIQDATLALGQLLSPTNINSLIQFGILLKGVNFAAFAGGVIGAVRWVGVFGSLLATGAATGGIKGISDVMSAAFPNLVKFAGGMWAAVAPIAAVTLAIAAVVELLRMEETKQALALLWGGIGELVTGDKQRGAAATQAAYKAMGGGSGNNLFNDTETGPMLKNFLTPHAKGGSVTAGGGYWVGEEGPEPFFPNQDGVILPAGSMGNAISVSVFYQPQFSSASRTEFERNLKPLIVDTLREQQGRKF
jgi:uncharacterized protein YukE